MPYDPFPHAYGVYDCEERLSRRLDDISAANEIAALRSQ
jgi:hypothetical protein